MNVKLMTAKETALKLGVSYWTLANWRSAKMCDLPYIKINGAVRYDPVEVDKYLAKHTVGGIVDE